MCKLDEEVIYRRSMVCLRRPRNPLHVLEPLSEELEESLREDVGRDEA